MSDRRLASVASCHRITARVPPTQNRILIHDIWWTSVHFGRSMNGRFLRTWPASTNLRELEGRSRSDDCFLLSAYLGAHLQVSTLRLINSTLFIPKSATD